MKILFINTAYAPNELGGAEIAVRILAEGVAAAGDEAVVISIGPDGIERTGTINGVRCHYVKLANIYWPHAPDARPSLWKKMLWHLIDTYNPVMAAKVVRIIDAEKPDVIHAHNLQGFSVAVWRAAHRRSVPLVQTLHGYYPTCPNSVMQKNGRNCRSICASCRLFAAPRRLLSGLPSVVSAVSARTLARHESGGMFRKSRDKVVIYGANLTKAAPAPRRDIPAGGTIRFGFLGRLEPIKGVDLLLEAMRGLPPGQALLRIGGRGSPAYMERLKRTAPGNVEFLGFVDPDVFFTGIDALVVPSLWEEPFPRVAHEALYHGVPVIASRLGGLPEIVEDGKTGYLFDPGNEAELPALLRRLVAGGLPAGALFEACRAKSRLYDFPRIFEQYMAALRRAAARARPRTTL